MLDGKEYDVNALKGMRVVVPLGKRIVWGIIAKVLNEQPDFKTRAIYDFPDNYPMITEQMFKLAAFISSYYYTSMGEVLAHFVPRVGKEVLQVNYIEQDSPEVFQLSNASPTVLKPEETQLLNHIRKLKTCTREKLAGLTSWKNITKFLRNLEKSGLVELNISFSGKAPRKVKYLELSEKFSEHGIAVMLDEIPSNARKQREIIHFMLEHDDCIPLAKLAHKFPRSAIKALEDKNHLISSMKDPIFDFSGMVIKEKAPNVVLTEEQQSAFKRISKVMDSNTYGAFLIYGVTGSGKTQVYIEAAKKALEQNKGVLILVPEIALTPQLFGRFRAQLDTNIALIHSAVPMAVRRDQWFALREGKIKVALGARSSLFAPVQNLGLILVDEEHDASFKQHSQAPYYNSRDLAQVLGKIWNATVVLGSATPSMESYFNSKTGKYTLIRMDQRFGNFRLPQVKVVDMRTERENKVKGSFSRPLLKEMKKVLTAGNKVILLLNRRGYSSYLQCNQCGYIPYCENCALTMTYHIQGKKLICHTCDNVKEAPTVCPQCGNAFIRYMGRGTQKIEEEITQFFPNVPVFRMDYDTTRKRGAMVQLLADFKSRREAIMIGTQMVAKGLDFPDVSVVGVLNADIGLTMPDFRAEERIFQLLTQVAGRAGRSEIAGKVIIQTFNPDSVAVQAAIGQKFVPFYKAEIEKRKEFQYPPFSRLIMFRISSEDDTIAMNTSSQIAEYLRATYTTDDTVVMGPVRAPVEKAKSRYRWQIVIKCYSIFDFLKKLNLNIEIKGDLRLNIIPDPIDMM